MTSGAKLNFRRPSFEKISGNVYSAVLFTEADNLFKKQDTTVKSEKSVYFIIINLTDTFKMGTLRTR